jgi:L-rhamnose mutarotase
MQRLYFALDLRDDPALIAEYEKWHRPNNIWPEIVESLRTAGIHELEIVRCGNRLTMVIEAPADFSVADQAALESANPRLRAWEELMWRFQLPLPFANAGEKWVLMKRIFSLKETLAAREGRPPESSASTPGA